jgi:nicotinamidase-related amidase
MSEKDRERPALLIVDMIKENFDEAKNLPITPFAREIISPINDLIHFFRQKSFPVVFSTDAFTPLDFFFTGKMKPHSLAGTEGAEIVEELDYQPQTDYWQQKPSMSAFFKTGLEDWLRRRNVTMCAVTGIATQFCVLSTAIDALCHDFKTVLIEDATASGSARIHADVLEIYRRNPLYPLFRVMPSHQFAEAFAG